MTDVLREITQASLGHIRKTSETPPRMSVYDVLSVITGLPTNNCSNVWKRLQDAFPEIATNCSNIKFEGQGQRPIPVADARGITEIILLLPGTASAQFRKKSADVVVKFLGGCPSLVEEIAATRLAQECFPEDHQPRKRPSLLFGIFT